MLIAVMPAEAYVRVALLTSIEPPIISTRNPLQLSGNLMEWLGRIKLARERGATPDPTRIFKVVMDDLGPISRVDTQMSIEINHALAKHEVRQDPDLDKVYSFTIQMQVELQQRAISDMHLKPSTNHLIVPTLLTNSNTPSLNFPRCSGANYQHR